MNRLGVRLLLGLTGVFFIAMLGFGLLVYLLITGSSQRDTDRIAHDKVVLLASWYNSEEKDLVRWIEQTFEPDRYGVYYQIWKTDGKLLGRSLNLASSIPLSRLARTAVPVRNGIVLETYRRSDGERLRVATYPVTKYDEKQDKDKIIAFGQAAVSLDEPERAARRLAGWLLGGALGALALALSVGALILRQALRPLEEQAQAQRRFVADAAHELRTPLTVLRGEIEVVLRRRRDPEDYEATLKSALEEIERLSRLSDGLLLLAAPQYPATTASLELNALCQGVQERLIGEFASAGIHFTFEPALEPLFVRGEADSLSRVVRNLLENALRYTPRGEQVTLRVFATGQDAALAVQDTGIGIAPEHQAQVFDRFYRVDQARARSSGGAGLGLAIARELVEAYGGQLTLESQVGRGSTFTVTLRVA